jgi:hypothetical protein
MTEPDLGGDTLKTVRYRIIFTNRNNETTLLEGEDTVNYATDAMSLSDRKIGDFFAAAATGNMNMPGGPRDRLIAAGYTDLRDVANRFVPVPAANFPPANWTLKEEDKKYVTIRLDVLDQLPKQDAEYDRQQVDVLKEIRDALQWSR